MTVTAESEQPRPAQGVAFSDAVTFAFGDPAADVYGIARVGLSPGEDGDPQGSGLAMLFSGREPVAVRAAGGIPVGTADWAAVDAAGVRTTTVEPLSTWTIAFQSEDGTTSFDLRFEALSDPAVIDADGEAARVGGMEGYEQLCHVTGSAQVRGGRRRVDCFGQRGHSWGAPDWDRVALARTIGVWIDPEHAVTLTAIRPSGSKRTHADEAIAASVFSAPPEGAERSVPVTVEDPRVTTTMDEEERQRRAGLELWIDPDGYPLRVAGEVLCGTSLDLGRLRLDCAFFHWTMDGRHGVGRYDILRRVAP
ncbi:hypothetical protein [Paraconexibacter sp.]|uniref:DUF7065 domain-containing protein n=1 Tax=Paraconexibacter sp. TaxID=2949640 RepID=UPI003567EAB8